MITIELEPAKPRGVRKATLTKKAAGQLRGQIDYVLTGERRWRLRIEAVDFLQSIRSILRAPMVRLSKKQRDTTEAILERAFSDAPFVYLRGAEIAELAAVIRYATGDGRVSSLEENVMANLRRRLGGPVVGLSVKEWRVVEAIKRKTHFGVASEPLPLDPDGLVENDDRDGLPPERHGTADGDMELWALVGATADD
ncbi:hypothetical protein [Rhodopila sp.]|uniref:hypothetical protein n=1 Tax=Rhodopila sp. TaxID=2480087 RepID=UPI003D0DEDF7